MPTYESDSSESEDDYSTTNVTLGYATTETTGDDVSHLGGLSSFLDPGHQPPAALAKCKVCHGYMSLLLQLNADIHADFPHDERRLHVLCCRKKACSKQLGSIRAFRETRKAEPKQKKAPPPAADTSARPFRDIGGELFGRKSACGSAHQGNPFSSTQFSSTQSSNPAPVNPFSTIGSPSALAAKPPQRPVDDDQPPLESFADMLKITSPPSTPTADPAPTDPWPAESEFPKPFPSFYLDAYPEELVKAPVQPLQAGPSHPEYDVEDNGGGGRGDRDNFESALDKTFQKFSDRIAQNPEQVIRYEFKGEPLLYSGTDNVASRFVVPHGKAGAVQGVPRCDGCGSRRVFEVQLVPGLIYELEKDETLDVEDGMEWGTILVSTCGNNCGPPGQISFREEWVGVQWEERVVHK